MEQLSTVQAEALCRYRSREVDHRRDKNCLPFDEPRRVTYAKQRYNLAQIFALLLQDQLRSQWGLPMRESAWAARQVATLLAAQWDMVRTDGWVVRRMQPGGVFNYWICDRAGVLEFITEPREDDYVWSEEALAAEEEMRSRGVASAEIQKLIMAIEGERLMNHYRKKPQTVWVLNLTNIIETMEESARDLGMELPPREDRAAWFGGK